MGSDLDTPNRAPPNADQRSADRNSPKSRQPGIVNQASHRLDHYRSVVPRR